MVVLRIESGEVRENGDNYIVSMPYENYVEFMNKNVSMLNVEDTIKLIKNLTVKVTDYNLTNSKRIYDMLEIFCNPFIISSTSVFDIEQGTTQLQWLLSTGCNINVTDEYGWNCLHYTAALINDHGISSAMESMFVLYERGADMRKRNVDNQTPLDLLRPELKQQVVTMISNIALMRNNRLPIGILRGPLRDMLG